MSGWLMSALPMEAMKFSWSIAGLSTAVSNTTVPIAPATAQFFVLSACFGVSSGAASAAS